MLLMIVSWIVFGFLVGLIARAIYPGSQPMGLLMTTVLGVVGSFVGGTIANLVALRRPRLVVLSLKREIEQALGEGLTLAELWRQLHAEGAFPAGYNRFRILVRRLITSPPAPKRLIAPAQQQPRPR